MGSFDYYDKAIEGEARSGTRDTTATRTIWMWRFRRSTAITMIVSLFHPTARRGYNTNDIYTSNIQPHRTSGTMARYL
jgi:hypothetical protein